MYFVAVPKIAREEGRAEMMTLVLQLRRWRLSEVKGLIGIHQVEQGQPGMQLRPLPPALSPQRPGMQPRGEMPQSRELEACQGEMA